MSAFSELVIDVGHSRIKWGRCRAGLLDTASVTSCALDEPGPLFGFIEREATDQLIWSPQSHRRTVDQLHHDFRALGVSCRTVTTGALDLPVAPAYSDLGTDRWLALQWPWTESRSALCVVDCGTAVTVDAVDGNGRHLGGWIMAGLQTMRRGLELTAPGLPAPEPGESDAFTPAVDSAQAIGRGLRLQLIGGIHQALAGLETKLGTDFACWLTGGDAPLVVDALERRLNYDPHLVLRGLALAGSNR